MNPDNTEEPIPVDLNKTLDALSKILRETKSREFNERIAQGVEDTRKKGAEELIPHDLNKAPDAPNREPREMKRQGFNERVAQVAEIMRKKGTKEREIGTWLKKEYEDRKHGNQDPLGNELPGTILSEVTAQHIDWLWQKRIPLGKITILDGDPGMGKSLLALHIAACLSTGRAMPDGTPGKQGSAILIAPEDSAEDTIKPRMQAAGGDPSQVLLLNTVECFDEKRLGIYERPFSLSRDLVDLEEAIKQRKAILVVLDPLMAVLGRNIDSSRDQDVREVFTPLAQLAERTGCAILIIRHLNKGSSDNILYRGSGSIGIIAAARIGLLVAHDPNDEQKRVFATIKNNLSKIAPNLTYQVVENELGAPYIQWLGENHYNASTLLRPGMNLSFERQEIFRVLKEASGPLDAKEIAEHTGLKYESLRSILNRMHEAREIIRPSRGKYTTPDHPSIATKNAKTHDETTGTSATSATSATNPDYDLDSSSASSI